MKVSLINHTPDPDRLITTAAKLCYSAVGIDELSEKLTDEKIESFIDMLSEMGHESPVEHASFTFAVEGVSRALMAQITRHRIASFSVQSQRYVNKADFEYIIPPSILENEEAREEFLQAMEDDKKRYERLVEILTQSNIEKAKSGKDHISDEEMKKITYSAKKKANEDARFVLPNACETKLIMTMNARSLMNFFKLRTCERAQWEIRALAVEMLKLVKEAAPRLFKSAGPGCFRDGKCGEGGYSCGRAKENREFFSTL